MNERGKLAPGILYCLGCITQANADKAEGKNVERRINPAITMAPLVLPNGQFVTVPTCMGHLTSNRVSPLIVPLGRS